MNYKKMFSILLIVLVSACLYYQIYKENNYEITLIEAYEIGIQEAKKQEPDAELIHVSSIDDNYKNQGINGKRRYWNLTFTSLRKQKSILITIHDKKIVHVVPLKNNANKNQLISINDIKYDSPYFINKAINEYKLKPGKGEDWASGYHYGLFKTDNRTLIKVVGRDENNNFTKIYFDAKTGEKIY